MRFRTLWNCALVFLSLTGTGLAIPLIVIFHENGFRSADSAPAPDSLLIRAMPNAQLLAASELKQGLASADLLVLPYGSAFPEDAWPDIYNFLQHGGNLLVLGGRPFTSVAYRQDGAWRLRDYSVRYTHSLMIDQYQGTPGSTNLKFKSNPDIPLAIPQFSWKRGFSPIIHLSSTELYNRDGSACSIDANLDALVWGEQDGRRLSAPIIQIDHMQNGFDGGRWIFVDAEVTQDFYDSEAAAEILSKLANQALQGAQEFTVRPVLPLYLPDEPVQLEVRWNSAHSENASVSIEIAEENGASAVASGPLALPLHESLTYPPLKNKGLYVVTATLIVDGAVRTVYHSAFWIRDEDYLRSGPTLSVNQNYFELDGQPLAVVGTTYMSSEVQRLYFDHPNVYVWDRDLHQIHDAHMNMLRTGWWTGWDKVIDDKGHPYERTFRTLEAYLMTARKYGLPVQFTFFSFLPEVLGGQNPYLDPEAVRRQKTLITAIVARFRDVPFLVYDLVNEPSFSTRLWTDRPNGDPVERQKWNEWLDKRYSSREELAAAWSVPIGAVQGEIPLPEDIDFSLNSMYDSNRNSLKIYDYQMFAQENFANWTRIMRDAIRQSGSQQLVTVGMDEGGYENRPSPVLFSPYVDFTTNHTYFLSDSLLWDSLVAKQPGKAMLIQEVGALRELNLDQTSRRTVESESMLFEHKMVMSFVYGTGAIEWLWNTNSYMTKGTEVHGGALRADDTEKPEGLVMRNLGTFAARLQEHLHNPQPAQVAIIASQAAQYSAFENIQLTATRKAVRALISYDRLTPFVIYESQIKNLGFPKLVILPSAQSLSSVTWQVLLDYVDRGGNLLITGAVDRDEHWQRIDRASHLIPGARVVPLTYVDAFVIPDAAPSTPALQRLHEVPVSFLGFEWQSWPLESLCFGTKSFTEVNHGKGTIFWSAEPIELAQGDQPAADVYSYVAGRAGIAPEFDLSSPVSSGVMIYPVPLNDSILYIIVSDDKDDANVEISDKATGTRFSLTLPGERVAMALIGRKEKAVIGRYGF
jgi:hypothetical protein